jgi:hypothetical protein
MSKKRDIEIPISNVLKGSSKKRIGHDLLSNWLHTFVRNGIQKLEDGKIGLGGEITEDTFIPLTGISQFVLASEENNNGYYLLDDAGEAAVWVGVVSSSGLNVYPDAVNLANESEINILSNQIELREPNFGESYIECFVDGADLRIKLPNLPEYADEAAAVGGGLTSNTIYKTATGELRIKL